ncbi:ribosome small subunit-dependent GTPase A [Lactiplantibacillus garii]|uniref:Small ribosomal subunit biogenesis GTPase RsgA n=1 Tax=Lactiplantibacillus garii TaxID=2306423 RepID=A0A426D9N8_9LACO|nr:ribosome small subunit-dependent GTPase A [Lactiplantibacillus garii]RRK11332.1 ribosome small subunit-dependent GTPase A [Lactiplantibacillus garii]
MIIDLKTYGLTPDFERAAAGKPHAKLGRVVNQQRNLYRVLTATGELKAQLSGKFRHVATTQTEFPTVGDWVLLTALTSDRAQIQQVLPRRSVLARGSVHQAGQGQLIAANLDTVFICTSLNEEFNVRRLERYLTLAWESRATPVIVLTKMDLCRDLATKMAALETVSVGVETIICSVKEPASLAPLHQYTTPGRTVAFIGSSGVGKSTLINALLGRTELVTRTIRADDDKGRHTTTARQLLQLPTGGLVIDTPGMRELQLYAGNLDQTFGDVAQLATRCRFNDCSHQTEPGCAVRAAVERGELDPQRVVSYQKLQREMSYQDLNARQLEQAKIERMFGGKRAMQQVVRRAKKRR